MTPSRVPRRTLDFRSWNDLLADAEHLARHGYRRSGRWSLAQVLDHVGAGLRVAVAGSPHRMPWLMRMSARTFALPLMRSWRWLPAGIPAPSWWQPQIPADSEDDTAVTRFRHEVATFLAHAGPYHPHPAFDRLEREAYADLMLIHASHHLGFLVPREEVRT